MKDEDDLFNFTAEELNSLGKKIKYEEIVFKHYYENGYDDLGEEE